MYKIISTLCLLLLAGNIFAQSALFEFGEEVGWENTWQGKKVKGDAIEWIQVNTTTETWEKKGDKLICMGQPIGVIRSAKRYRNFVMHIEWRHMEAGGNSGTFVWSDANADDENRLPNGVEVQMLELDWVNLNKRNEMLRKCTHMTPFKLSSIPIDPT